MVKRLVIGLVLLAPAALAIAADARAAAPVGTVACVAQTFDAVTPPALPAGWSAWNAQGADPVWSTAAADPDTPPNVALLPNSADVADKRLESQPIPITMDGAQLSFRQAYEFRLSRSSVDGGVLEMSSDGGPFFDLMDTGATFLLGGYNGLIGGNPLDGRQGWVESSGGFSTVLIDLGANLAGHTVVFRWRMGSGGGEAIGAGWRIDTLTVAQSCVLPVALRVDEQQLPTIPSSVLANGVLEPGETVVIDPVYQAVGSGVSLFGTAEALSGPVDPPYAMVDASADYGEIGAGAASDCYSSTGNCYVLSLGTPAERNGAHLDAVIRETLSNGGVRNWRIHIGETFDDVPPENLFYRHVETLLHGGVTAGCAGGSYCPDASTVRKQMAVFVLKAKFGPNYEPRACHGVFADVACPGPFTNWIEDLYARGIAAGCGAGPIYCPDAPVSRQQMAVFLLKTRQGSAYVPPECTGVFPDVPCSSPFAPWIEDLYFRNIAAGCSGGNFCPTAATTRGQMAPFLVKTFALLLY